VNDEGLPIILDLIDQLHGLRRALRDLLSSIAALPEPPRRQILSDIRSCATLLSSAPAPRLCRYSSSWTVLKTWQVGGVSDSIGSMDSELNPCEANGGFSTL